MCHFHRNDSQKITASKSVKVNKSKTEMCLFDRKNCPQCLVVTSWGRFLDHEVKLFCTFLRRKSWVNSWGRFLIRDFRPFAVSSNFFVSNSCKKVGRRRTAQLDRAISMKFSLSSTFKKSTPGCHYCVIACVTGAFA